MIQEELTKLADEADDEDGEGDAEKDEAQAAGQEVEAWQSSKWNMTVSNYCTYIYMPFGYSSESSCTVCIL